MELKWSYTGKEGDPENMKNSDCSDKREVAEA
jgi:hypothetical protein